MAMSINVGGPTQRSQRTGKYPSKEALRVQGTPSGRHEHSHAGEKRYEMCRKPGPVHCWGTRSKLLKTWLEQESGTRS